MVGHTEHVCVLTPEVYVNSHVYVYAETFICEQTYLRVPPSLAPTHSSEAKKNTCCSHFQGTWAIDPLLTVRITFGVYTSVFHAFGDKSSRSLCLYPLQKSHMSDTHCLHSWGYSPDMILSMVPLGFPVTIKWRQPCSEQEIPG